MPNKTSIKLSLGTEDAKTSKIIHNISAEAADDTLKELGIKLASMQKKPLLGMTRTDVSDISLG